MRTSANNGGNNPQGVRLMMGLFMILFYLGVGLLCIFDVFNIVDRTISCILGGLIILYGIWRGIRLYLGSK